MDKVFVNSLPKSGTHLLSKLLSLVGAEEQYHFGSGKILDKSFGAVARKIVMRPSIFTKGIIIGIDSPAEVSRDYFCSKINSLADDEFVTGHVGYSEEIIKLCDFYGLKKICVVRDPRAVVVSFVHYVRSLNRHYLHETFKNLDYDESVDRCVFGYVDSRVSLESLKNRYRALQPWFDDENTLVLKFEDLVGSAGGGDDDSQIIALEKIFLHLNIENNGSRLKEIAAEIFGPGKATFRKGQVDSWKVELSNKQVSTINNEMYLFNKEFHYD